MLLLLIGAVIGPQLLFIVQDRYLQRDIYVGERDGMDMISLDADYPRTLQSRMRDFARGLAEERKYRAYATEQVVDEECYAILDDAFGSQDWLYAFGDMPLFPYAYYPSGSYAYEVTAWKRYVICDEEFENGVAVMAWYFEFRVADGMRIKLLFDTEDYTLYAIWFEAVEPDYQYRFAWEELTDALLFWIYYYDADKTLQEFSEEYAEAMGKENDSVVAEQTEGVWDQDLRLLEEDSIEAALRILAEEGHCSVPFMYGENQLHWELLVAGDHLSDAPDLCMGIREIWTLIPELPQAE